MEIMVKRQIIFDTMVIVNGLFRPTHPNAKDAENVLRKNWIKRHIVIISENIENEIISIISESPYEYQYYNDIFLSAHQAARTLRKDVTCPRNMEEEARRLMGSMDSNDWHLIVAAKQARAPNTVFVVSQEGRICGYNNPTYNVRIMTPWTYTEEVDTDTDYLDDIPYLKRKDLMVNRNLYFVR